MRCRNIFENHIAKCIKILRNIVIVENSIGVETTSPTKKLDVNGDGIRIRTSKTPSSSTSACNQGEISWDYNYTYVCVSSGKDLLYRIGKAVIYFFYLLAK